MPERPGAPGPLPRRLPLAPQASRAGRGSNTRRGSPSAPSLDGRRTRRCGAMGEDPVGRPALWWPLRLAQ
ncbi:MAG TPA: hypothetical protein DCX80_06320 [Chloroflexi bacterium]|nr:hypothetical protein [Chloroflexota bacterium]